MPPGRIGVVFHGLDRVATVPPTLARCREEYGDDSAIVFDWVLAAHQADAARDAFGSYDAVWYAAGALCAAAVDVAGDGAAAVGSDGASCHSGPGPRRRVIRTTSLVVLSRGRGRTRPALVQAPLDLDLELDVQRNVVLTNPR